MMICGHRGASLEAPENTLGGFRHARQVGVRAIELDVRLSQDGQCVVIHDDTVDRTTDGRGPVRQHTAEALARLRAHGRFPEWPTHEGVPTLQAALECISHMELILIEIKKPREADHPVICDQVMGLIDSLNLGDRAVVASADAAFLAFARRARPEQPRGMIGGRGVVELAMEHGCAWVMAQFQSIDADTVRQVQARGMRVACWTPNTEQELAQTIALRPDVIITDVPTTAQRLIQQPSPAAVAPSDR